MLPSRRIDHVSRQCEEPALQTIREGASAMVEVLGLGNSLVDLLAYADDQYLSAQEMLKGAMNLIDEERAEALYAARVDPRVISGGSAASEARCSPGLTAYLAGANSPRHKSERRDERGRD